MGYENLLVHHGQLLPGTVSIVHRAGRFLGEENRPALDAVRGRNGGSADSVLGGCVREYCRCEW